VSGQRGCEKIPFEIKVRLVERPESIRRGATKTGFVEDEKAGKVE